MPSQRFASFLRKVFWGPNGIRAGWRLLIFFAFGTGISFATEAGLEHFPPTARILSSHVRGVMTAPFAMVIVLPALLASFLGTLIMSKIERRSFGTYGLPLKGAFGKLFWQGVIWGLGIMSVEMTAMYALGDFSFGTFALSGFALIKYGLLWAFSFLLVGFSEQFQFRGYAQYTLTTGMGFWPAALLLSLLFGASHLRNLGENWVGILDVVVFAAFCCFTLRRTGNLWFAVGMHAAGDFAESFLYAVPNSGLRAVGTLLNSSVHGPRWLTGGTVGPEGSVLSFILLGLSFFLFDKFYPARTFVAVSPADGPSLQA